MGCCSATAPATAIVSPPKGFRLRCFSSSSTNGCAARSPIAASTTAPTPSTSRPANSKPPTTAPTKPFNRSSISWPLDLSDAIVELFLSTILPRRIYDGRPVLEPSHFLPFAERGPARDCGVPAVPHVQQDVEKMQTDAGDQNRGHWHQGNHDAGGAEHRGNDRALVLAEQFRNAVERDRIDIPRIAGNIGDHVDGAVVRRVEAVVHAGCQSQRNVLAIAIE